MHLIGQTGTHHVQRLVNQTYDVLLDGRLVGPQIQSKASLHLRQHARGVRSTLALLMVGVGVGGNMPLLLLLL